MKEKFTLDVLQRKIDEYLTQFGQYPEKLEISRSDIGDIEHCNRWTTFNGIPLEIVDKETRLLPEKP